MTKEVPLGEAYCAKNPGNSDLQIKIVDVNKDSMLEMAVLWETELRPMAELCDGLKNGQCPEGCKINNLRQIVESNYRELSGR